MASKRQLLKDADTLERRANGLLSGDAKDKAKARELLIRVRKLRIRAEGMK